jgi:cation:H+ antiporter
MLVHITLILVSMALMYAGAEALVRGSSALALRFGLTPLVVGLTVVAIGTSSPELVVSVKASLKGISDIALGNVIGSNICNIALILGIASFIHPMKVNGQIVYREIPVMIGISLIFALMLMDKTISRYEAAFLVLGMTAYTWINIMVGRREADKALQHELKDLVSSPGRKVWLDVVFVLTGLLMLPLGAELLVSAAVEIATRLGLSKAVIGLTIVAIGTSLPELATSAVASIKKQGDISIGNVLGSNISNILLIIGFAALFNPIQANDISVVDLGVMLGLAVLSWPIARTGFLLSRMEGTILLLVYCGYIYYLIPK